MRTRFERARMAVCISAVWVGCGSSLVTGQDATPNQSTNAVDAARPPAASVDVRYRSPRATVRTFLIAMNQAEDDPHKIDEAVACLDLSGIPPDRRDGGRLAFGLEFILRSTNIPTTVIADAVDGAAYTIGENKDIKLTLRRMADGRWLFDSQTLQDLSRMRLFLWQRDLAASQGKATGDVPADFRSPYAMFHTFIDAFKKGDLDTAARCLDLTEVPDPARQVVGRGLALKLKEVLDRSIFVIFQDLPDSSVGVPLAAVVHPEGRITAERQVEGARKGQWLFNRGTVRSLDGLYDAFESKPIVPELAAAGRTAAGPAFGLSPGLWLRHRIPALLRYRVGPAGPFSFGVYQVIGMALLVLLVVPAYRLVVWPLTRLFRTLMRWRGVAADDREVAAWVRPLGWLAAAWVLVQGVTILDLRLGAAGALLAVLVPAFWLAAALAAYQLIDPALKLVAGPAVTQEGATTLAAMGFPVVSLVLKILVVACGLAMVLTLFDFDVATVLAGLGIGGLAFALAAQDTLKNFFGSLMLIADRTFRVGDLVQIGGNEGVVESVGLRTTRIRGLDDSLLTIPNSDLTTAHVTNFGARRYRRFRTRVTVPYGTPPDRLIQFRDGILDLVRQHAQVRQQKYEIAVNDLGACGIEILIQVFFEVPDGHTELLARDQLIVNILRLAEQLEVALDSPKIVLERERSTHPRSTAGDSVPMASS
ncbi:MAG: mechanosensitive ion channel family protein [Isosphaeraceae bacterium]|nr:mechanosensitive ion channel family protein [Isosphaeraceae bacterium]